jgi:hypothetical protein
VHARRRRLAFLLLAFFGACAQAPSERLDATSSPVAGVRVFVAEMPETNFAGEGSVPFVQTMQRNGLPVLDVVVLAQAMPDLAALERAWNEARRPPTATHALVITRQRVETVGALNGGQYVRYEAVLWSAGTRRLVWKGSLASLTNLHGQPASKRMERLAGDTLRGLARDGLVTLPSAVPRDAAGAEIPATLLSLRQL